MNLPYPAAALLAKKHAKFPKGERRFAAVEIPSAYHSSPDLPPLENMWGKVKEITRKIEPRTEDEIWHATN